MYYRADKRVSRYKTLDEQRAERRSYFSEKEIAIDAPTAPPRQKRPREKRMSVKDFKEENRQTLFQSDHQTEEGKVIINYTQYGL